MAKPRRKMDVLDSIERMIGHDPALRARIEEESLHAEIAARVLQAREAARMTQAALARKVGTSQSAIARLENAEYRGHSIRVLRKIACALGLRLEVRLVGGTRSRAA